MAKPFQLILFSTDAYLIRQAVAAGVHGIMVDWEKFGKPERQKDFDTQISCDTLEDLQKVRACTEAPVICRINNCSATISSEIEMAIEGGADEILLPMVRSVEEVATTIELAGNRCKVGILIETDEAINLAGRLGQLYLSRVYVGLNDISIQRRCHNIFVPLVDGTVERIRGAFSVPFGFGGLTLPDKGYPIPCRLLMGEMVRLKCDFSFLRRSFHSDMAGRNIMEEVPRITETLQKMSTRGSGAIAKDRVDFMSAVNSLV